MEQSLLHSLQLTGLIVALGGPVFVLGLLEPARRRLGREPARDALADALSAGAARWVAVGALTRRSRRASISSCARPRPRGRRRSAASIRALVARFATATTVGKLTLARIAFLVLAAAATRMPGPARWPGVAALGVGAMWCAALTSHAAALPAARIPALATQLAHVAAGGAWIGVLLHLLAARSAMTAHARPPCLALIAEIVRRFSPVALAAASLLLASGVYAAARNLPTPVSLVTSAYGLTLLVKLVMVVPVLVAGGVNYRIVRPHLLRLAAAPALDAARGAGGDPALRPHAGAGGDRRGAGGRPRRAGRIDPAAGRRRLAAR